jgi:transposase
MFGKDNVRLAKKRCGVVGILWKILRRRERNNECILTTIDEYYTSQVCNTCALLSLKEKRGFKVLTCTKCNAVFDRNINAAKNMMLISLNIWKGDGRPEIYKPKKRPNAN